MTTRNRTRTQNRFRPGQSGNPAGRPRGSRNRATVLRDQLLRNDGETLVRVLRDRALGGDVDALKFLVSRILPPAKELPETTALDLLEGSSLSETGREIIQSALRGEITDTRAKELTTALKTISALVETEELETRLRALEERMKP